MMRNDDWTEALLLLHKQYKIISFVVFIKLISYLTHHMTCTFENENWIEVHLFVDILFEAL